MTDNHVVDRGEIGCEKLLSKRPMASNLFGVVSNFVLIPQYARFQLYLFCCAQYVSSLENGEGEGYQMFYLPATAVSSSVVAAVIGKLRIESSLKMVF